MQQFIISLSLLQRDPFQRRTLKNIHFSAAKGIKSCNENRFQKIGAKERREKEKKEKKKKGNERRENKKGREKGKRRKLKSYQLSGKPKP